MRSQTVQVRFSAEIYKDIEFDEVLFSEIVQIHQVRDIIWFEEHPDVEIRMRDPLPAEAKWLELSPGATVAVAVTAPGVVFAYIEDDESELVAVVVQYHPDLSSMN